MFGVFQRKLKTIIAWAMGGVLVAGSIFAATGFKVDSFGNITGGRSSVILAEGDSLNCMFSVSGSTLSVVGWDGNALSVSNPCKIRVKDASGQGHVATFNSPVSVTFGSSSDTDGNDWGLTNSVNWGSTMPFFANVITDGTNDYFAIGRRPRVSSGSNTSDQCQKNDTDCDNQDDQMILASGLTLANWTSKAETPVGWFDATFATSGTAWTFGITGTLSEGFNKNYIGQRWAMPAGQNGANSSYPWSGTTPATWATPSSIVNNYWFANQFMVCNEGTTVGAGNATNGTGSNNISLRPPLLIVRQSGGNMWVPIGTYAASGSTPTTGTLMGLTNSTADATMEFYARDLGNLFASHFTATTDDITWSYCYPLQ